MATGKPIKPTWLPKEVQNLWEKIVNRADLIGVVKEIDTEAIARYAEMLCRYRKIVKRLHRVGQFSAVFVDGKKRMVTNPEFKAASDLADRLLRLEKEFGMTSSARAHLIGERKSQGQDAESAKKRSYLRLEA